MISRVSAPPVSVAAMKPRFEGAFKPWQTAALMLSTMTALTTPLTTDAFSLKGKERPIQMRTSASEQTSAPLLPVASKTTTVAVQERTVGAEGAKLRYVVIDPADPDYAILPVLDPWLGQRDAQRLMRAGCPVFVNGTFFSRASRMTLGDVVGLSLDSGKMIQAPFKVFPPKGSRGQSARFLRNKQRLENQVHQRYLFYIDLNNQPHIIRRSALRDAKGQPVPQGERLPGVKTAMGGLACIDLRDSTIRAALSRGSQRDFAAAFNRMNPGFNDMDAYNGLEGYTTMARAAVGLVPGKDGRMRVILGAIGNGANRNTGATIMQLAQVMAKLGAVRVGVLDGGSSVHFNNRPSSGGVTSGLVLHPRKKLSLFA